MVKDLVCGMTIDPGTAGAKSDYKGQMYYFCSKGCKAQFDKNPDRYIGVQHDAHAGHQH